MNDRQGGQNKKRIGKKLTHRKVTGNDKEQHQNYTEEQQASSMKKQTNNELKKTDRRQTGRTTGPIMKNKDDGRQHS